MTLTDRDVARWINLIRAEYCEMPAMDSIPDLVPERERVSGFGIDLSFLQYDPMNRPNEEYFRELANYEFAKRERFIRKEDRIFLRLVSTPHAPLVRP